MSFHFPLPKIRTFRFSLHTSRLSLHGEVTIVALKFAMSSHFPLPKIFSPSLYPFFQMARAIAKLNAAGIRGSALKWFESFLENRNHVTVVNGHVSSPAKIHAGVPQGAILSPLLFSIYVNDITTASASVCDINFFADDTLAFVSSPTASALQAKLQLAADVISCWFSEWHLTVNSSTLRWAEHIDSIIYNASRKFGVLRRLRRTVTPAVLLDIYTTCIRPTLEYANLVWCGPSKSDCARLERCQRSAARIITWHQPSCRRFTWSPACTCRSVHIGNATEMPSLAFFGEETTDWSPPTTSA